MAALLKDHWGATFAKKEVDFKDLNTWWKEDGYSFIPPAFTPSPPVPPAGPPPDPAWTLSVQH
eukprot:6058847-Heterocapsa_arctica.AAC.1